jgi:hypothetical protein
VEGISVCSNALIRMSLMFLSILLIPMARSIPFNLGILMSVRTNRYLACSAEIASHATKGSVKTFTTYPFPDNTSLKRDARSSSSSTMPIRLRLVEDVMNCSFCHYHNIHSIFVRTHLS